MVPAPQAQRREGRVRHHLCKNERVGVGRERERERLREREGD